MLRCGLGLCLLLMPSLASAQSPRFMQRQGAEAWQPVLPACQCRADGRHWSIGAEVCLDLGRGRRAFVCGMQQNVTSWQETGRACPES